MRPLLLVLFACAPLFAEDLEGARDNFDTVVRSYAAQRSDNDGVWTHEQRGTGKALKLIYGEIERETVHPTGGGRWRGIADFTDKAGNKKYYAEVVIATGGDLWDVKSWNWRSGTEVANLRVSALKAAKTRAARKPGPKGMLPDLLLADATGRETYLPDCSRAKCLTIYVAPWCGYCRAATPAIKALRDHLISKGVPVRVIVGKDAEDTVRAYAAEFGPDTLLDPDAKMSNRGVPHFYASQDGGAITEEQSGADPNTSSESTAASLGL